LATVRANIIFSVALKLVVFAVVLAGYGSLWLAVVADVGASMLVTLNGMRLLRAQPFPERRRGRFRKPGGDVLAAEAGV
jgi:Cd2+/Zn2+-exporting ATPase